MENKLLRGGRRAESCKEAEQKSFKEEGLPRGSDLREAARAQQGGAVGRRMQKRKDALAISILHVMSYCVVLPFCRFCLLREISLL